MSKMNKLLIGIIIFLILLVLYQTYFILKINTEKESILLENKSNKNSFKNFRQKLNNDILSFDLRHEFNTPFNNKFDMPELEMYNFLHKNLNDKLLNDLSDFDDSFKESVFNPQIEEAESKYKAYIEIPNIENQNISIEAIGESLIISGTYSEKENNNNTFLNRSGTFKKVIPLPNDINIEKITSTQENGILIITLPKNKNDLIRKELNENLI